MRWERVMLFFQRLFPRRPPTKITEEEWDEKNKREQQLHDWIEQLNTEIDLTLERKKGEARDSHCSH